jgi:hypothetical protein
VPRTPFRALLRTPPGRWFHLALVPVTALLLYAASVPGYAFFTGYAAGALLLFAALMWAARTALYLRARRRGTASGSARWLAVAPVAGLAVVALLGNDVPLRLRWSLARDDFARAARLAPPPAGDRGEWVRFAVPDRIGSYRITGASRVGDGVVFTERTGALMNDAGFAYLPTGPFPEMANGSFETPDFYALGGGWYGWTASW